jgi:predicted PurR-regulated permease PerM
VVRGRRARHERGEIVSAPRRGKHFDGTNGASPSFTHERPWISASSNIGMDWENARRQFQSALIWVSVAALAFLVWHIRYAVLLAFAAAVLAILLNALGSLISRLTRVPPRLGLTIASTLIVFLIAAMFWRFGSQLSSQFSELVQQISSGEQYLRQAFNGGLGPLGLKVTEEGTTLISGWVRNVLSIGLSALQATVVIAVAAIYLAAEPDLYRKGISRMFGPELRSRAIPAIDLIGRTLKLWLLGQFCLMILIGILSYIALTIIGIPNALALAVVAGLTEAIPYIGPFIGAIPAILVALTVDLNAALWTAGAYFMIQMIEGYVTTPLTQRYFVTIPPAVILAGIVTAGLIFGTIGVIMAAPMTIVVFMAIKMMYVDDPLDEHRG